MDDRVGGWPIVAELMAEVPEYATFSRFRELNIKNILYYQVELDLLRRKLKKIELKDQKKRYSPGNEKYYSKRAEELIWSQELAPGSGERKQWDLVINIRECLRDYSNTHKYNLYLQ